MQLGKLCDLYIYICMHACICVRGGWVKGGPVSGGPNLAVLQIKVGEGWPIWRSKVGSPSFLNKNILNLL